MKVGILESREDSFINDVVSLLKDVEVEFLSFQERPLPISSEYRVVVDRRSFRYPYLQEILKSLSLDGTYVINNPFSASATNKLVDNKICSLLGIPSPRTMVLPDITIREEFPEAVAEPSWDKVIEEIGLPCVVKPFDGYAWRDVYFPDSAEELKRVYYSLHHSFILLVQQLIRYKDYYRAFCFNKREVLFVKWVPRPSALGEYLYSDLKPIEHIKDMLTTLTIKLNSSLDLDVNVVEWCVDEQEQPWVIDAYNEVPDVDKRQIPEPYYQWIKESFAECVLGKLSSQERNRSPFALPGTPSLPFTLAEAMNPSGGSS